MHQPKPFRAVRGNRPLLSILTAAALLPSFGFSEEIPENEANDELASAQSVSIDDTSFDPNIGSSLGNTSTFIPHVTIVGAADGTHDFYSFSAEAGDRVILDIDGGSFDTVIRIYDSAGDLIDESDDSDTSQGAGGSDSGLDSFYEFVAESSGTYFVQVLQYPGDLPPESGSYRLNISAGVADATIVALKGQTVDLDGTSVTYTSFGSPAANEAGTVTFTAKVIGDSITTANDSAIFVHALGEAPAAVAFEGTSIDLDGTIFKSFKDPIIAADDSVYFRTTLTGPLVTPENDSAIWGGSLGMIAREGGPAGGVDGAVYYSFSSMATMGGNLLYTAKLKVGVGGVTSANSTGLWVYDENTGEHAPILRTGTNVDLGGTSKLLKSFKVLKVSSGTAQTRHTVGSAIIYQGTFGDGTTGIFRIVR